VDLRALGSAGGVQRRVQTRSNTYLGGAEEARDPDLNEFRGWHRQHPPPLHIGGLRTGEHDRHPARPEPRESEILPVNESAFFLGRGLEPGRTPVVPRYVEMIGYAMDRVGWNPDEFRLFRCIVEYPMVQSMIRLKFLQPADITAQATLPG
jgi:hypothetical protein